MIAGIATTGNNVANTIYKKIEIDNDYQIRMEELKQNERKLDQTDRELDIREAEVSNSNTTSTEGVIKQK